MIDDAPVITHAAVILDGRYIRRLPKEVAAPLMRYSPRFSDRDWAAIRVFVLDAVAAAAESSSVDPDRAMKIAAPFVQWAVNLEGLPLEANAVFTRPVIDAYCESLSLTDGSVGTYRSILRAISDQIAPTANPEPSRPISRRSIQDPYVGSEVDSFRAWAHGQHTTAQTRKAKLLLSAGAGAGLRPNEIGAIRPADVDISDSGITIHVHGAAPRQVTLLAEWESMFLEAIAGIEPPAVVWGDSSAVSKNKNLVTTFAETCTGVAPIPSRMRASWLVTLLDRRVHMTVVFDASGFKQFNNLYQYVQYLTRPGRQDARAQLRGSGRA